MYYIFAIALAREKEEGGGGDKMEFRDTEMAIRDFILLSITLYVLY